MQIWRSPALLFGESGGINELANRMADGFRGNRVPLDSRLIAALILGAAGLTLAIWFLSRLTGGHERRSILNSPRKLFVALCRAHGLAWNDTRLLWRLARRQHLDEAARLFLEPDQFDVEGLGPALAAQAGRLRWLRDRIFAGLAAQEAMRAAAVQMAAQQGAGVAGPAPPVEAAPSR